MKAIRSVALAVVVGLALTALQGCSVNVIVAPDARLEVHSRNSDVGTQTANQYNEQADIIPVLAELYSHE